MPFPPLFPRFLHRLMFLEGPGPSPAPTAAEAAAVQSIHFVASFMREHRLRFCLPGRPSAEG